MDVRRISTALLVVPLLALGACGGTDSSIADPPVSSPPTSAPTTDPPQQESPEHFIRRWVEQYNSMQNTGDTGEFKVLSRRCKNCLALAKRMDRIYSSGGYVHTKGWKIRRIETTDHSPAKPVVEILVFSNETTYQLSEGGEIKHFVAGNARFQFYLQPNDVSWGVDKFNQLAS